MPGSNTHKKSTPMTQEAVDRINTGASIPSTSRATAPRAAFANTAAGTDKVGTSNTTQTTGTGQGGQGGKK
ncbi:hypothetical protein AK830_g7233 [Neonectria ditissima]|uniref:Uncharacterized protein n=1 Tax=Neonectria ditissima TaxID=78410 RepID=A0A0P7BAL4_9HYPO|nr:hypothetical protein AK830_g7233 [Neonectria ditissima]